MKTADFKSGYLIIILAILAFACARPVAPEGGPKDPDPPKIVEDKSSPNFQTNFDDKLISLEFDEWVNLNNPVKNILISPPIEFGKYEVKLKGKKVIIEFDDDLELLDSVTYQINFGDAISDYTENNILKNFRYVFSTGDVLDSLRVVGKVTNSLTEAAEQELEIYLYEDLSDTVFTKGVPYYFTTTDEFGKFEFQNIRKDSFQIFALRKNGIERRYTKPGETVAFLDSLLILNDSVTPFIFLETFEEEKEQSVLNINQKKGGVLKYRMTNPALLVEPELELEHFVEHKEDSILIWYQNPERDSFQVILPEIDTSWFKYKATDTTQRKLLLDFPQMLTKIRNKDTLNWISDWPFESFEKDSVLIVDTIGDAQIDQLWIEGNRLKMTANLVEDQSYEIILKDSALINWNGNVNDSISFKVTTAAENEFGDIIIEFEGYKEDVQYIFELMQKEKVVDQQIFKSETVSFISKRAGEYSIRIIEDTNSNGKWDTGSIDKKRQPESVFSFKLEELRVGWDLETNINLSSQ